MVECRLLPCKRRLSADETLRTSHDRRELLLQN